MSTAIKKQTKTKESNMLQLFTTVGRINKLNLEFFKLQTASSLFNYVASDVDVSKGDIYWKDHRCKSGYGPFLSMEAAMQHYNQIDAAFNEVRTKEDGSITKVVTRVDFVTKKRIE